MPLRGAPEAGGRFAQGRRTSSFTLDLEHCMTRWIPSLGLLAAACTMTLATAPVRAAEAEPALTITRVGSVASVKGAVPANFTEIGRAHV